ncbi:MAG: GH3 auxin-responsive promoter family protein [Pseudomonadota bacterium]
MAFSSAQMSIGGAAALPGQQRSAPAKLRRPNIPMANEVAHLFARYRLANLKRQNPALVQQEQMRRLVAKAKSTKFGRDHDFANIKSVKDFQARVPLRTYNQLWNDYWKAAFPVLTDVTWPGTLPYYAVSSGTSSGKVKYIPCSRQMVRANKRSAVDIMVHHCANHPGSRVLDGKAFILGGSTDLTEHAPGIKSGDISGIAASETPVWGKPYHFPPPELALAADWEQKMARILPRSLEEDIRMLSGAPGWLAVMFEKLAERYGTGEARIADFYPNLELLVHGGVSFEPYRKRFESLLEGSKAQLREVYAASEGFIAVADRGPGEGMRLNLDNGIFFEFVPVDELESENPTRLGVGEVEMGVDYAIVLTTCAGLWSYVIGDVVEFVDTNTPRILIKGRTSYMLSGFGEHLTGELVQNCLMKSAEEVGLTTGEFTVGTEFAKQREALGRHVYVVEVDGPQPSADRIATLAERIDDHLARANEDYYERRIVPQGVQAPVVHAVPQGTFAGWLRSRGKYGGQHKVPRVASDFGIIDELLTISRMH